MTVSTFPAPPRDLEDQRKLSREQSRAIEGLLFGRSNNVLDVTCTANSGTTTVTDRRIGVNTVLVAVPTTANAEAAAIWPYRDFSAPVNGSASLIHTNDANADKTYKLIMVG